MYYTKISEHFMLNATLITLNTTSKILCSLLIRIIKKTDGIIINVRLNASNDVFECITPQRAPCLLTGNS